MAPTPVLDPALPPAPGPSLAPLDVTMLADIVCGLAAAEPLWRPHVTHDPDLRARLRLLATPAYEVWLLGWTPGQAVGLHDHGDANGAFVVVEGTLTESRLVGGRVVDRARPIGAVGRVPRGAVHDVANRTDVLATSIHAYSWPLTSMGFYDPSGDRIGTERVDAVPALVASADVPRVLHPASRR
ncbi:MAG: cysteine dioxygenase family protein [Ilumatobacteraceae bacterium]